MNDRTRPEWIEHGLAVATLLLAVATFAVAFYARRSASDSAKAIAAYLDSVDIPPSVSTVIIDDAYVAPGGEGRLTLYIPITPTQELNLIMEPPVLHFFSMASGEAGTAAGRLTGNGTLAQPPPSLVTSKEWVLDGWVDVQPASLPQK